MFCRKGNLLALKWKDKRDVYILTGIYKADSVVSLKRTYKGEKKENLKLFSSIIGTCLA